jgi:hypothetical protein
LSFVKKCIAGGENFWLADPNPNNSNNFYNVNSDGSINNNNASNSNGVRPIRANLSLGTEPLRGAIRKVQPVFI